MLAGFLLVPWMGVHSTVKLGIVINLAVAVTLCLVGPRPLTAVRWAVLDAALVVAAIVVFLPGWDLQVMSSGAAVHAPGYLRQARSQPISQILRTKEVLFYEDGTSATVSVTRSGQHLALRVNGKPDASTDPLDMQTQLMTGICRSCSTAIRSRFSWWGWAAASPPPPSRGTRSRTWRWSRSSPPS